MTIPCESKEQHKSIEQEIGQAPCPCHQCRPTDDDVRSVGGEARRYSVWFCVFERQSLNGVVVTRYVEPCVLRKTGSAQENQNLIQWTILACAFSK